LAELEASPGAETGLTAVVKKSGDEGSGDAPTATADAGEALMCNMNLKIAIKIANWSQNHLRFGKDTSNKLIGGLQKEACEERTIETEERR
jgi:hypothetical protein